MVHPLPPHTHTLPHSPSSNQLRANIACMALLPHRYRYRNRIASDRCTRHSVSACRPVVLSLGHAGGARNRCRKWILKPRILSTSRVRAPLLPPSMAAAMVAAVQNLPGRQPARTRRVAFVSQCQATLMLLLLRRRRRLAVAVAVLPLPGEGSGRLHRRLRAPARVKKHRHRVLVGAGSRHQRHRGHRVLVVSG